MWERDKNRTCSSHSNLFSGLCHLISIIRLHTISLSVGAWRLLWVGPASSHQFKLNCLHTRMVQFSLLMITFNCYSPSGEIHNPTHTYPVQSSLLLEGIMTSLLYLRLMPRHGRIIPHGICQNRYASESFRMQMWMELINDEILLLTRSVENDCFIGVRVSIL